MKKQILAKTIHRSRLSVDSIPTASTSKSNKWSSTSGDLELKFGQHDFRLLLESVSDYAVYMLSPEGIVSSWNKGAERNKGYTASEAIGLNVSSFYTPEDQELGEPAKALTAALESKFETYGWRVRKDGSRFWAHVVLEAIRNRDGNLLGFAKVTCDVTAQKIDRDLLVNNLDAALTNMSQGLCMFDAQESLILANSRVTEILGFSATDLTPGTRFVDFVGLFLRKHHNEPETPVAKLYKRHLALIQQPSGGNMVLSCGPELVLSVVHRATGDGSWVTTIEDISERSRTQNQVAHMAMHDALTDLPNRVMFRQKLAEAIRGIDSDEKSAILCLDLDRFKTVNDTLGHPVGDALLVSIASRLRGLVRGSDTVARLGGDEFAIIMKQINNPAEPSLLAERLVTALALPTEVDGHLIAGGVSIGIARFPEDGTNPDELLKCADLALYRAKALGRGRYCYFEPEMDAELQKRRLLEMDLRIALGADEFELYYQPIIDVSRDNVCGFEALLRWHSPRRGMVPPVDFIPIAEEIGLIVDIGNWVLQTACMEAVNWPDHVKVAVNVSVAQFKGFGLVQAVQSALANSGLSPTRLEIEITESIMINDSEHACEVLYQLKDMGISISMDDFGTGYSSLGYLRSFPFDKIKIDRSFTQGLGEAADCNAIVQAVMGICDSLGIVATAEGVETESQMDMLRSRNCHQAQGYLISKPRPASAISELMTEGRARVRAAAV